MKINLKVAALAGVLLFGLVALTPLLVTAPVAEDEFKECADNDVCLTMLLSNDEFSLSGGPFPFAGLPTIPAFETWLYLTNPSEDIERNPPLGLGEDNVVGLSLTLTATASDGAVIVFSDLESLPRFDPVVHASETRRIFFFGLTPPEGINRPGDWEFEYSLVFAFRGEVCTLTLDFEIEVEP